MLKVERWLNKIDVWTLGERIWKEKDKRGETVAEVRRSERSTGRESVRWMKHDDKSLSGSKSPCACVFTDHVETETASLVCFHVCVCVCVCTCGPCVHPRLYVAPCVCYMWMAVSHGHAVDAVTDSLVKFR